MNSQTSNFSALNDFSTKSRQIMTAMVCVTPDLAEHMLAMNQKNRNLRPGHVASLARDMKSGDFKFNGDAIRFDTEGDLLDGQHRLSAIIASGIPQEMLIIKGLPSETMRTIDSGVNRTNGDRLSIVGYANGTVTAAAASIMGAIAKKRTNGSMTASEIFHMMEAHPRLVESATKGCSVKLGLTSLAIAFHYIGSYTGYPKEADEFLHTLKTGEPFMAKDPVHTARERIIRLRSGRDAPGRNLMRGIICSAWEAKRTGRPLHKAVAGDIRAHGWNEEDLFTNRTGY